MVGSIDSDAWMDQLRDAIRVRDQYARECARALTATDPPADSATAKANLIGLRWGMAMSAAAQFREAESRVQALIDQAAD